MCIIIAKPYDAVLDEAILRRCYAQNPDGWGIMFADKRSGTVETLKSTGPVSEFLSEYKKLSRRNLFVHFRWRTHGDKDSDNCHPFDVGAGVQMMHNGIISVPIPDKRKSDTAAFADLMKPYVEQNPDALFKPKFWDGDGLKRVADGNRLVFLNGKGRAIFVGRWVKDKQLGCRFSNYNYLSDTSYAWEGDSYPYKWARANSIVPAGTPAPTKVSETKTTAVTTSVTPKLQPGASSRGVYGSEILPIAAGYQAEITDFAGFTYKQTMAFIERYPYRAATLLMKAGDALSDTCRLVSPANELDDENA